MTKAQTLQTMRSLHGWLGVILLPWIIAIGATGFYHKHARIVLDFIEPAKLEESTLFGWPEAGPVDREAAGMIAGLYWPQEPLPDASRVTCHGLGAGAASG